MIKTLIETSFFYHISLNTKSLINLVYGFALKEIQLGDLEGLELIR